MVATSSAGRAGLAHRSLRRLLSPPAGALPACASLRRAARPSALPTRRRRFSTAAAAVQTSEAERLIALEDKHGAHNYHPLPVVLERGKGVHVSGA